MAADKIVASGLATPCPAMSGALPWLGSYRPLLRASNDAEGMVKLLAHADNDRILGCHIFGPSAADLVQQVVIAMEFGASAEDLLQREEALQQRLNQLHSDGAIAGWSAISQYLPSQQRQRENHALLERVV